MIKSVGIFCGSSKGKNPIYEIEAIKYTKLLVENNIKIVYGGGNIGIMGVISKTALENNGVIIGVAPGFIFEKEVVNSNLTELIVTRDMLDRKEVLMQRSDAFVILPGGIGTLDEFFEVLTALQLETMIKPIAILNTNNYYNPLIELLKHMVEEKFFRKEHFESIIIENEVEELHKKIMTYTPQKVENWVDDLKIKEQF